MRNETAHASEDPRESRMITVRSIEVIGYEPQERLLYLFDDPLIAVFG